MTFLPSMESRIDGISVVSDLQCRSWNGAIADVWQVECAEGAGGEYVSPYPRLFVVLDKDGAGGIDIGASPRNKRPADSKARSPISYVPAGLRLWSRIDDVRSLRHLDLHFDMAALADRFERKRISGKFDTPRLMFEDERIMGIARLIALECATSDTLNDLYGESLLDALLTALLQIGPASSRRRSQMPPWQLRRAKEFIEEHCLRTIRLAELAALTGLSESYFCHAFKASTGMPAHQWQMRARIARVQEMLRRKDVSLTNVAAASGFSDQAHLTRVFRRVVGTTPASWKRNMAA